MEINEDKLKTLNLTESSNDENSDGSQKMTFTVTCDRSDEELAPQGLSKKEIAQAEIIEKDIDKLEVNQEGLFKRKVSELMEEKEIWEELKKESRKDFGSVAQELLKKSSIYAVSQVGHAGSPYKKILWVLVLVAGVLGCCYEVHRFLVLFFQYPVVVNLQVENNWKLEFPAVTVCNLNRMSINYEECFKHKSEESCLNETFVFQNRHKYAISEWKSIASCSMLMNGIMDDRYKKRMEFLSKYVQTDAGRRKSFEYELNEFILNCSYNGESCPLDFFSKFQSMKYGNCFTFNKRTNESNTTLITSFTGIMNGLDLVLNLEPETNLSISTSLGARIIIHDPDIDPNPEEQGVSISPGFETTLSMKQTGIRRLPPPYKDQCVDYEKDTSVNAKNQDECITSCIQEQNYAKCSCIDPTLLQVRDYKKCNMSNTTEVCCLDDVLDITAEDGLPRKCSLPCSSTKYNLQISTALWPSETDFSAPECNLCPDIDELQKFREKHARILVYYSTLERATYEQKEVFQNSELFSQIGGQMGLWLGLSLAAAFEIIENLIHIGKYCANHVFSPTKT